MKAGIDHTVYGYPIAHHIVLREAAMCVCGKVKICENQRKNQLELSWSLYTIATLQLWIQWLSGMNISLVLFKSWIESPAGSRIFRGFNLPQNIVILLAEQHSMRKWHKDFISS